MYIIKVKYLNDDISFEAIVFFSAIISRKSNGTGTPLVQCFIVMAFLYVDANSFFASDLILNYYGLWYIAIIVMSCSSGGIVASVLK